MKQEKVKKLKWMKPCLESFGNCKITAGICTTGGIPDAGDPSCINGSIAANACTLGGDPLVH